MNPRSSFRPAPHAPSRGAGLGLPKSQKREQSATKSRTLVPRMEEQSGAPKQSAWAPRGRPLHPCSPQAHWPQSRKRALRPLPLPRQGLGTWPAVLRQKLSWFGVPHSGRLAPRPFCLLKFFFPLNLCAFSSVCWLALIIPAPGRLGQEDCREFEASLNYPLIKTREILKNSCAFAAFVFYNTLFP